MSMDEQLSQQLEQLRDKSDRLEQENQILRSNVEQRFAEIAELSKLYLEIEAKSQVYCDDVRRLAEECSSLKAQRTRKDATVEDPVKDRKETLELQIRQKDARILQQEADIAEITRRLNVEKTVRMQYERELGLLRESAKKHTRKWTLLSFKKTKRKRAASLRLVMEKIRASGLFDSEWYLLQYPDVADNGIDPVEHYIRFGANEGRNPSPLFSTVHYLTTNIDVAAAKMNPLLHYIDHGKQEGRQIKEIEGS